eukprot:GEMP01032668.1.p1 GENE.GEMP01032668.1~~GEMP01032668.1.p1  ORF type:complete len:254 (+),score=66.71 GEMP01032668.1:736-1497(+)
MTNGEKLDCLSFAPLRSLLICGDQSGKLLLMNTENQDSPVVDTAAISALRRKVTACAALSLPSNAGLAAIIGDSGGNVSCYAMDERRLAFKSSVRFDVFQLGKSAKRPTSISFVLNTPESEADSAVGLCVVWCRDDVVRVLALRASLELVYKDDMPIPSAMCLCTLLITTELTLAVAFPDKDLCVYAWPAGDEAVPGVRAVLKDVVTDDQMGGIDVVSLDCNTHGFIAAGHRSGEVTTWRVETLDLPEDSVAE